jgi:hypothetical protein
MRHINTISVGRSPAAADVRIRVCIELLEQASPEQRLSRGDILLRQGLGVESLASRK